jgi:hypothetical protein
MEILKLVLGILINMRYFTYFVSTALGFVLFILSLEKTQCLPYVLAFLFISYIPLLFGRKEYGIRRENPNLGGKDAEPGEDSF